MPWPASTMRWLAMCAVVTGCTSEYRMGDPIAADAAAKAPAASPAQPKQSGSKKAQPRVDVWGEKWLQIQSPPDTVPWNEHFQVCQLKYRYRNYGELFRCLDLFEAKVTAGGRNMKYGAEARAGSPAVTGWLRASAYAELGEPQVALKWAESAWNTIPDKYRQAQVCTNCWSEVVPSSGAHDFETVCGYVGGGYIESGPFATASMADYWRSNPAGLDMSPYTITMNLAAQRSLLYQHLGEPAKARAALEDLRKWESVQRKDGLFMLVPTGAPFKGQARLLALGPRFAMGEYAAVATTYEEVTKEIQRKQKRERALVTTLSTLLLPFTIMDAATGAAADAVLAPFTAEDARLFAIAVEDASNALIYAQSLARLGKTDAASRMLDTLLALPRNPWHGEPLLGCALRARPHCSR